MAINRLFRMGAIFLFFGGAQPGIIFSTTNPAAGMESIAAPDRSGDGPPQDSVRKNFKLSALRDPFESFVLKQQAPEGRVAGKPRTYLETVDLSQLDLIAVILSPDDRWAMLRDAKGIGYIVKRGTRVGNAGGKVYRIGSGKIIIRSKHRNSEGKPVERKTVKRLCY